MWPCMNQRHFQRVKFCDQVYVKADDACLETSCLDISLRGMLLARPGNVEWALEQPLLVTLILSEQESIEMNCSIVHLDDKVVGCVCDSMDIDSMSSLRCLLEYNLSSTEQVNREFGELIRQNTVLS